MNSLLFFVRRTPSQVRLIAAESFNLANGTYVQMRKNHTDARDAAYVMDMLQIVAAKMNPHSVTAATLVSASESLLRSAGLSITLLPARGKLPSRILVKDAL